MNGGADRHVPAPRRSRCQATRAGCSATRDPSGCAPPDGTARVPTSRLRLRSPHLRRSCADGKSPAVHRGAGRIFGQQPEAEALLEDIEYPRALVPNWQTYANPTRYWAPRPDRYREWPAARRAARSGWPRRPTSSSPGTGSSARRPSTSRNRCRSTTVTTTVGTDDQTGPQRIGEWPTLIFQGSDQYDAFVRLVREVAGPQAELLYATGERAAVLVRGIGADGTEPAELVARLQRAVDQLDLPEDTQVEVRFERYAYRPHLIERLRLIGPDQQIFYVGQHPQHHAGPRYPARAVRGVPRGDQDRPAGPGPPGRGRPGAPGADAGRAAAAGPAEPGSVPGGGGRHRGRRVARPAGEHRLAPIDQTRLDALKRVRNEIEEFAEENASGFRIVDKDDPYLPTVYEIEFSAPGFGPPEDMSGSPDELQADRARDPPGVDHPRSRVPLQGPMGRVRLPDLPSQRAGRAPRAITGRLGLHRCARRRGLPAGPRLLRAVPADHRYRGLPELRGASRMGSSTRTAS